VREANEESNRLRLKIDAFLQQDSKAMVKNKELSKKIEELVEKLAKQDFPI
jgi:hypothetical protein